VEIPLHAGDFVWTRFPYEDDPDNPGPVRHAACVIAVFNPRIARVATTAPVSSRGLVVGVYTSSQVEKFGDTLPIGVIQVPTIRAGQAGEVAIFYRRSQAGIHSPYAAVLHWDRQPWTRTHRSADKSLLKQIIKQYQRVNDRHGDLIVNVGPLRP
jgi:hypothetical protein